jgi:Ser/Thr protein kinase RdoA (MazF antagonist)
MPTDAVARVLELLGVHPGAVSLLKDEPSGNGNWLVALPGRGRVVLRRYHPGAGPAEIAYEHAVLGHLAAGGWTVPDPLGEPVGYEGHWYCLTRYVAGRPVRPEGPVQRRRRGRDLARLHLALRGLGERLGQRPGWRPAHATVGAYDSLDWRAGVRGLTAASPRLGAWAESADRQVRGALAAAGAGELPLDVIHGDFAEWNVHYGRGRLAGVIDFGLAHLDSRPYELAIARTYRAPEAAAAYRDEVARGGWPLSPLEEAAVVPVYRAFRLGMAAWQVSDGLAAGRLDLAAIERQLSLTGIAPA